VVRIPFAAIALIGLGPALKPGGEGIIAWIAQAFLQLVLFSVIMVGQNVQSLAADARSASRFKGLHTQGGLKELLDRLDEIATVVRSHDADSTSGPTGEQT
jgi:hypothetical protein